LPENAQCFTGLTDFFKPGSKRPGTDQGALVCQLAAKRIFENGPGLAIGVAGIAKRQKQASAKIIAAIACGREQVMHTVLIARVGRSIVRRADVSEIEQFRLGEREFRKQMARSFGPWMRGPDRKAGSAHMHGAQGCTMLACDRCQGLVVSQCFDSGFDVGRTGDADGLPGGQCSFDGGGVACMGGVTEQPQAKQDQGALIIFMQQVQALPVEDRPYNSCVETRLARIDMDNGLVCRCGG
jgi:hypothetical protein